MEDNITSPGPRFLTCPICEAGRLLDLGRESSRCDYCGCLMGGLVVRMIREITSLPDATGKHACECGHPEMRRLPDGVYWCPACGAEVLPVKAPPPPWSSKGHSEAYWNGWMDGRFKTSECFTENRSLTGLQSADERLDYYRGHRAGQEARRRSNARGKLLEAS